MAAYYYLNVHNVFIIHTSKIRYIFCFFIFSQVKHISSNDDEESDGVILVENEKDEIISVQSSLNTTDIFEAINKSEGDEKSVVNIPKSENTVSVL